MHPRPSFRRRSSRLLRRPARVTVVALLLVVVAPFATGLARGLTSGSTSTATAYDNPVYGNDFPDPFVLRVANGYVAYGTNRGANVQTIGSTDLAHWFWIGDALPTLPSWAAAGRTWAPAVASIGGHYALYYTVRTPAVGLQCISRAVSSSATGPFVDHSAGPLVCQTDRGGSIDPTPFVDADGSPWLIWKSEGTLNGEPTRVWSQRLTADGLALTGPITELVHRDQPWEGLVLEGPSMVRQDGRYWLFYSANFWDSSSYAIGYAICTTPAGPCVKPQSGPIVGSYGPTAGPGGPSVFRDGNGALWLAYHAWTSGIVGYSSGGARSLRIDKVDDVAGRPVVHGPTAQITVPLGRALRRAGADRYATAAMVSATTFAAGAPVAYVATGTDYADALAGGPAAAHRQGPLLLTAPTALPPATAAELERLRPQSIVVLGGAAAVSDAVVSELGRYTAGSVTRIAGDDRYGTASAVSAASFSPGGAVAYVATGAGYADALAGGPAAARDGAPLLLVDPHDVPAATAAELNRLEPGSIVVLGGSAAVGDEVVHQLATSTGASVRRIAGIDRYATAAAVADTFPAPTTLAYAATGRGFADALAAAAAAGTRGAPLLLVDTNVVPTPIADELRRLTPRSVVVLGGTSIVGDATFSTLDAG